jgi:hypothetical protein
MRTPVTSFILSFGILFIAEGMGNIANAEENQADGTVIQRPPDEKPPTLAPDLNANVASVVEAKRDGEHPERLSVLVPLPRFDLAKYNADKQAYVDVIEPGRVFQSAAPGENVPVLSIIGKKNRTIPRKGTTPLQVAVPPGGCASFIALDLGTFDNGLTSITVIADEKGVATANLHATAGVRGPTRILVGSPMASGQVSFRITVLGRTTEPAMQPSGEPASR